MFDQHHENYKLTTGIACDIGIENRLAIENTRLLLTYATIDPARVRTLVLFRELSPTSLQVKVYMLTNSKSMGQEAEDQFALSRNSFVLLVAEILVYLYQLTLSDGFTLMVLYYLVHVKQPPVLPNLQRIAPLTALTEDQIMLDGRNIYFFDDVEILRREWSSINYETVGELCVIRLHSAVPLQKSFS